MNPGDHLVDNQGNETPYRVEGLVAAGDRYQIAEARDEDEDRLVAIRAILYGETSRGMDDEYIDSRRRLLERQWDFLEAVGDQGTSPEPVQWLEVEASPVKRPPEPVIVCERIDGIGLYEFVVEKHPQGVTPEKGLEMIGELADFLTALHHNGWLWRDFDPERFVVDDDGRLRAVSIGNAVPVEGNEQSGWVDVDDNYTAPQLRDNVTASHKGPAADLYGLGALASFVLTGEEPRHRVESPLSYTAHQRIRELDVPGIELLLARLLQPMAEKRLDTADRLRQFCSIDSLPSSDDEGFSDCRLPAPWEGLDMEKPEENRGLKSQLSSGPLVSMGKDESGGAVPDEPAGLDWTMVIWVLMIVAVAAFLAVLVAR